ncbi:hypothetical protein E2C01_080959 [Portunus trituberculatus]|uniref:Uncharacterized protein n=1 Tax=Portunus trituberculatus TaxID=210409 RepID=A0A5B7IUZ9_PORTR|nr:hypothetical protein [Portunus trituberculatus]
MLGEREWISDVAVMKCHGQKYHRSISCAGLVLVFSSSEDTKTRRSLKFAAGTYRCMEWADLDLQGLGRVGELQR